jgi:hypothetical protein
MLQVRRSTLTLVMAASTDNTSFSYFASKCIATRMVMLSHSIFACGFAVASSVAVVYDWGERDNMFEGLIDIVFLLQH